jgi:hypothetical protein
MAPMDNGKRFSMKAEKLVTIREVKPFWYGLGTIFLTLGLMLVYLNFRFPSESDGGFISHKPCAPPCLDGIVPGKTSKEAVITFLEKRRLMFYTDMGNNHPIAWPDYGTLRCQSLFNLHDRVFYYSSAENKVESFDFVPRKTIYLHEVIGAYGEPSFLYYYFSATFDDAAEMVIFYDDLQAELQLETVGGPYYDLTESTKIIRIIYHSPDAYSRMVDYVKKHAGIYGLQKWGGYGIYDYPYP